MFGPNAYVFVAYHDNMIVCLNRDGLKRLTSASLNTSTQQIRSASANDLMEQTKYFRASTKLASFDVTFMGHLLVATDNLGNLYCFKMSILAPTTVNQAVNLLEYCFVTGLDSLDVLLTLKTQMLEGIVDKLTENFNRQPSSVIQYYYVKFLTMKINLYRYRLF